MDFASEEYYPSGAPNTWQSFGGQIATVVGVSRLTVKLRERSAAAGRHPRLPSCPAGRHRSRTSRALRSSNTPGRSSDRRASRSKDTGLPLAAQMFARDLQAVDCDELAVVVFRLGKAGQALTLHVP